MKSHRHISALLLIAAAALSACSSPQQTSTPYYASSSQSNSSSHGVIESIQTPLHYSETRSTGTGAVIGGLVGALAGNQIGSGNGRTVATVAGAVGGAVVGNHVEQNNHAQSQSDYQIQVRLDNGERITIARQNVGDLKVGNRVSVINGQVSRY